MRADARLAIATIKTLHSLVFAVIGAAVLVVLWDGAWGHADRRTAAAAVVVGEIGVFAGNGFRCPLTAVAERLGADRAPLIRALLVLVMVGIAIGMIVEVAKLSAAAGRGAGARRGRCSPRSAAAGRRWRHGR